MCCHGEDCFLSRDIKENSNFALRINWLQTLDDFQPYRSLNLHKTSSLLAVNTSLNKKGQIKLSLVRVNVQMTVGFVMPKTLSVNNVFLTTDPQTMLFSTVVDTHVDGLPQCARRCH